MKKNFISLIVLLLPLLLLTACGNNKRPSLEDRIGSVEEGNDLSYEGTIQRLENLDVYQQGTHQIFTDDYKTIIIQSPTINLNRYVDEEVLIKGNLEKGIGDAEDVFSVSEISYVDESKSAELQDYENKLFGFHFSHPSTWILDEGQSDLGLSFEEKEIISIAVFSDETNLSAFASSREDEDPTEVTIGAQKALRFISGSQLGFYVPNPPKKKIYLIKYNPSINAVDDKKSADAQRELFYNLLDSFELIYLSQVQGDKCGGLQQIECPEEHICQFESDGKYSEGVCLAIGEAASQSSCPFIAPPTSCNDYRISEYSLKGCPSRYECVGDGTTTDSASFRDLNVVDAGEAPEGFEVSDDESRTGNATKDGTDEKSNTEVTEKDYDVPELSELTYEYVNSRKEFSVLMPKTWYFASFGAIDGTLWKVGFSNVELEESEEAIITLSLQESSGGSASKEIDGVHYVFEGPSDLKSVMEKMAQSVEAS